MIADATTRDDEADESWENWVQEDRDAAGEKHLDGFIKSVIEKAGATKGSDSDPLHALGTRRDKILAEIATEYPSKIVKPFEILESLKT